MAFDIEIGNNIYLTYGTPVMRQKMPDSEQMCEGLKRIILAAEKEHPEFRTGGRSRSNQGGWRSKPDLLQWPGLEISLLGDVIESAVTSMMQLTVGNDPSKRIKPELSTAAWTNVNRDGDYNVLHVHPGNHWSGVFYVSTGQPDADRQLNGFFEFYDPRNAAVMEPVPGFPFGYTFPIEPEEGVIIVFPSWMQHAVHPFRGKGERISISFNTIIKRLDVQAEQPG